MASVAPVPPPEGLPGKVHLPQSLAAGATFASRDPAVLQEIEVRF